VSIEIKEESREVIAQWMPGSGAEDFVVAANIQAKKLLCIPVECCPEPEEPAPAVACEPGSFCGPTS